MPGYSSIDQCNRCRAHQAPRVSCHRQTQHPVAPAPCGAGATRLAQPSEVSRHPPRLLDRHCQDATGWQACHRFRHTTQSAGSECGCACNRCMRIRLARHGQITANHQCRWSVCECVKRHSCSVVAYRQGVMVQTPAPPSVVASTADPAGGRTSAVTPTVSQRQRRRCDRCASVWCEPDREDPRSIAADP